MFLYLLLLLFFVQVNALPLLPRQAAIQPTSVTTVQTINSGSGPVTQTCVIVLTPIKDDQGKDAVREVKTCTVSMAVPNPIGSGTNPSSIPASQSSPSPLPSSSPTPVPTSSSASSSPVATVVTSSAAPTTTLLASTSSAVPVPTSSSSAVAPSSTPAGVNDASTVPPPAAPTSVGVTQSKASLLSTSTGLVSGSAAAAQATATNSAFTLPGKKLSVLPIGLGVFAGISVIALIVVGLVTYERTKYRKAFRQRKLAETGAAMGYGGNMV